MRPTYKEILNEVLPLFHKDEDRFMNFYHAVYNLLASIPEGESVKIDEHCAPQARDLFTKLTYMYIVEETIHRKSAYDSRLELLEDENTVRHVPRCVPATHWKHFYSK